MSGLDAGSTLGGYKILARLRAGAMGALYLARRMGPAGFARPVAIKVIHDHLAANARFARMFIAEAKVSARIDDPHVVRVEEFGEADGRYFLVMEFVHGVSLSQALAILRKRGGLPIDVSVAMAIDIANGLHAAHEATDDDGTPLGIVHRDVSPHNVLVSYAGHVKVIDFGIAKAKQTAGQQTLTGSIRGKLAYMPPEQARSAKHVDRRADLYALGLVLWEMLVGRRMFDAKSDLALLNQIRNPTIVPPSQANPRVPGALDAVVMKLLEQDPARRPATGVEVARMLAAACPTATKVLPADVAAVMNAVREVATSAAASPVVSPGAATAVRPEPETLASSDLEDDEDPALLYGEEIKKNATLFDREMQDAPPGALAPIEPMEPIDNATKVMMKPPVAPSNELVTGPVDLRRTFRLDAPPAPSSAPVAVESAPAIDPASAVAYADEITKNHRVQVRPGVQRMMATPLPHEPPPLTPPPASAAPTGTKLPPWLSGPVLFGLTVVFGALLAVWLMQCTKPSGNSGRATVTTGTVNRARTPLENAREAAAEGNSAAVRSYLEKGVRGGKATTEEVQLVQGACMQQGDLKCVNEISKKYPSVPRPQSMLPP